MKTRLNTYFTPDLADRLAEVAAREGLHRSQLIEMATAAFIDPERLERQQAAWMRRLDRLSDQVGELADLVRFVIEAHGEYVQLWLRVAPPLTDGSEVAARARVAKRFDSYVDDVNKAYENRTFQRASKAATWAGDPIGHGNGRPGHEDRHVAVR